MKIEIHGHRGSRATHPENTFPSLDEAFAAGAQFAEIDLHLTADHVAVVFHDIAITKENSTRFDRAPIEQMVPIRRVAAEDLLAFDVGSTKRRDFPKQRIVPGCRIPMFHAVADWLVARPDFALNIELKVEAPTEAELPPPNLFSDVVMGALASRGLLDRVMLQSFDGEIVGVIARRYPKVRTALLVAEPEEAIERALACGAKGLGPMHDFVDATLVGLCHAKGLKVVPWTVNHRDDWRRLLECGVDGIITDAPRDLAAFLASHPAR